MSTLLVAGDDADLAPLLIEAAAVWGAACVHTAPTTAEAIARLRDLGPAVVIADAGCADLDPVALCRAVKRPESSATAALFVLVRGVDGEIAWDDALDVDVDVDEVLARPFDPIELRVRLRALGRLAALPGRDVERDIRDVTRVDEAADLVAAVWAALDLHRERSAPHHRPTQRLVDLCATLAESFRVPPSLRSDLRLASALVDTIVAGGARPPREALLGVAATLEALPSWRGAATVLRSVYENWDGSGTPGHLEHGDIPLRSRILRVALDFVTLTGGDDAAARRGAPDAVATLAARAGTCYDPLVVRALDEFVADLAAPGEQRHRDRLHVDRLMVGMVLADDLYTGSGAKLLARGTVLGHHTLELILRRHQSDPIAGAWVEQSPRA